LAGVFDYKMFWESMDAGESEAIKAGESYGLKTLLLKGINGQKFSWFDTGNVEALKIAREALKKDNAPNILEKENEAIWFVGNRVIKYSDNQKFISDRVIRAAEIHEFIPSIVGSESNMYAYSKAEGKVLSQSVNLPIFKKFLDYSLAFWQKHQLSKYESEVFKNNCLKFYKDKTEERISLFYQNFGKNDGSETINGEVMPTLNELLEKVDWLQLSEGAPGRFHGDFHFENIIFDDLRDNFIFLDWRQDFGGSVRTGDIYYDLAKLLHGLIISHEIISKDLYSVSWNNGKISFDFHRKQVLVDCENYYYNWLKENGYNVEKVKVLTALIYLNIAALHHKPYCYLLYALGKRMLHINIGGIFD